MSAELEFRTSTIIEVITTPMLSSIAKVSEPKVFPNESKQGEQENNEKKWQAVKDENW